MRAAGLGVSAAALSRHAAAAPVRMGKLIDPGRKLRIASIGCGGKGVSDINGVSTENIVALCDVDPAQAEKIFKQYPDAPKYQDYRKMLEEMDEQIDAVTVSTPDHTHFAAGMAAITRGKHVFIQKPLAASLWEVRELQRAARKHGVMTQMGNQGHAKEGVRLAREWVQGGVIGDVREAHVWTAKLANGKYRSALRARPKTNEAAPDTLDWNLWVGTAPMRPYSAEYCPWKWRGWWAFGNGALGDIGCHTMDAAFYALDLGAPAAVTAETADFGEETFPDWSIITYEFPARGAMPPVKLVWYDGGKLPKRPKDLGPDRAFETRRGYLMYGDKGTIYDPNEKCEAPRIVPESKMRALASKPLPKTVPRVPGGDLFQEWINACKGGPKAGSNFDYAGPLSETVLLGNLAILARGKRILWDSENLRVANAPELNKYIRRSHRKF